MPHFFFFFLTWKTSFREGPILRSGIELNFLSACLWSVSAVTTEFRALMTSFSPKGNTEEHGKPRNESLRNFNFYLAAVVRFCFTSTVCLCHRIRPVVAGPSPAGCPEEACLLTGPLALLGSGWRLMRCTCRLGFAVILTQQSVRLGFCVQNLVSFAEVLHRLELGFIFVLHVGFK